MKTKKLFSTAILAGFLLFASSCEKESFNAPESPDPDGVEAISTTDESIEAISADNYEKMLGDMRNQIAQNQELTDDIVIKLDNGNELHFLDADSGEFLVIESHECPDCSALGTMESSMGETPYTPMDIYWAFSQPGTIVPQELRMAYDQPEAGIHTAQGWARSEIQMPDPSDKVSTRATDLACNNVNFVSSIAGGFIGNPNFIRLDKTPGNYSPFQKVNSNTCMYIACVVTGIHTNALDEILPPQWVCSPETRYRYRATYSNVKKWRGKVCGRPIENGAHSHKRQLSSCFGTSIEYMGPILSFEKRKKDNLSNTYYWTPLKSKSGKTARYELPGNKTRVYSWYANSSKANAYRIAIDDAKVKDQFDIMMDK